MKPIEGYNKLRGGYYTSDKISEFIAEWAIRKTSDSVLEPSCGDGSFLSAVTIRYRELGATDEQTWISAQPSNEHLAPILSAFLQGTKAKWSCWNGYSRRTVPS